MFLPQSSPVHDLKFLFLHELTLRPGVYACARAVTICGRVLLLSRPHRITFSRIFPDHRGQPGARKTQKHKDRALDQGYLGHNTEQESGGSLSGFTRKAKPVTLISGQEHAHIQHDHTARARVRSITQILAAVFSLVIAAFSIYILARAVSSVSLSALRQAIAATGADQIAEAALLTVLSYLALTGYDGLALRQLRLRVPYKTTALASFTSYAISFTLGFPLITAGTVRYWIYSQAGLTASKVASLTVIAGVTLWFGMVFVIGAGLTFHASAISMINQFYSFFNVLIGMIVLGAILAYLAWVTIRRRHINIKGFRLELPGPSLTVGQIILGVIDQSAAAGALYVLLSNHAQLDFFTFAATYVFACILGVASNAPGGIGVFEAVMLKAVAVVPEGALLASLVLFRVIYYLVPFLFALAFLGAHESFRHWTSLREAMRRSEEETVLEDEINPLRRWYRETWRPKE
jgi:glycosyltransferase 2 family protein